MANRHAFTHWLTMALPPPASRLPLQTLLATPPLCDNFGVRRF